MVDVLSKGASGSMLCHVIHLTKRHWDLGDITVEFRQQRGSQILIGGTLLKLVSEIVTHKRLC